MGLVGPVLPTTTPLAPTCCEAGDPTRASSLALLLFVQSQEPEKPKLLGLIFSETKHDHNGKKVTVYFQQRVALCFTDVILF